MPYGWSLGLSKAPVRANVRLAVYHWGDRPLDAWQLFQQMPCLDAFSVNTALAACPERCEEILAAGRLQRLPLDFLGSNAALKAFAETKKWRGALALLLSGRQRRLSEEPATCSGLLKVCRRAQQWQRALRCEQVDCEVLAASIDVVEGRLGLRAREVQVLKTSMNMDEKAFGSPFKSN